MPAASAEAHARSDARSTVGASGSDEASTVFAARRGDRAAFALLHARYARMVHGIALARVPSSHADDLVQEAFMLALDRLHLLRDDARFGPWLAAIARNLAAEFHRGGVHRPGSLGDDAVVARRDQPRPPTAGACEVLAAIRGLPEAYSETLVLRLVEGLTGPQIAACTGLTHGSVRINLMRGMDMLRERLRQMNIDPEVSP